MQNSKKNAFAKYSSMAFQLLAYIFVGYLLGAFIDTKLQTQSPIATILSCVFFVCIGMYSIIKDVLNDNKK